MAKYVQFKWYVLNEDFNQNDIIQYNIFRNYLVNKYVNDAVRKYIRSPSKYKYEYSSVYNKEPIYGFPALCEEIKSIICWQEWSRCEYEIVAGSLFKHPIEDIRKLYKTTTVETFAEQKDLLDKIKEIVDKGDGLKKLDCYMQCEKNIEAIARECIWQYKHKEDMGDLYE